MRIILTVITFAISQFLFSQSINDSIDWDNPNFAFAKAYIYNLKDLSQESIIENDCLNKSVYDSLGLKLSNEQSWRVIEVIRGNSEAELDEKAFCYNPHHGIVFYDDDGKPIGHISICFYCGQLKIVPDKTAPVRGLSEIREIIENLGHPVFDRTEDYYRFSGEKK